MFSQWTHFLSIPLDPDAEFSRSMTQLQKAMHVNDRDIFVKPARLHMTLCMLHLQSLDDIQIVIDMMKQSFAGCHTLTIDFDPHLKIMKGKIDCASLLYAEPKKIPEDILKAADLACKRLKAWSNYQNEIKWHVTLMNTKYSKNKKIRSVNAEHVLRNTVLNGTCSFTEIHLSKLGGKQARNEYYEAEAVVPLNPR